MLRQRLRQRQKFVDASHGAIATNIRWHDTCVSDLGSDQWVVF